MFTGLVREIGTVAAVGRRGALTDLTLDAPATAPELQIGDSLAVDGICLTVTAIRGPRVTVEAVGETRRLTSLGRWRPGRRVHLEPALKVGDSMGGHSVLGHVDGVGRLKSSRRTGGGLALSFSAPAKILSYLLPKGSIAVDGVSLTLDEGPFDRGFSLWIIPHTLAATKFGSLRAGDLVNIEADVLAKAVRDGGMRRAGAGKEGSKEDSGKIDSDRVRTMGFRRTGRGSRYGV